MMRFWVSAPKTTPNVRRLDSQLIEHEGVVTVLGIIGIILVMFSAFLVVVPHALLFAFVSALLGSASSVPEGYVQVRTHTDRLRIVETRGFTGDKPLRVSWYQTLYDIDSLECNLAEFLATLDPDDYAFSHTLNAYNTVRQELWEATSQWKKIEPFLNSPKDSTKALLAEEYRQICQRHEAVRLIVDSVFDLSLRSASFTRAPKEHLDILVRELEGLCQSMEELDNISSNALPVATVDLSFRESFSSQAKEKVRLDQSA